MPPENAEIGLVAASVRSNCSSRCAPRRRASVRPRPWRRAKSQRFSVAVRFSSTEANCPVTPSSWRTRWGSVRDVVAEDLAGPAVDREEGGEHLEHGGLAGAVGAEDAEDLAAVDLEVDAVDGAVVAELS